MNRMRLQILIGTIGLSAVIGIADLSPFPLGRSETSSVDSSSVLVQAQSPELREMTIERLEAILRNEVTDLQGDGGQWQVNLDGQPLIVLADAANNRMRIVTPITPANTLSAQQVQAMLVANFHSALDARYAVTDGAVVAIFVHPLSSLQAADLVSGLRQVASLATTFGSTYSSGGLDFLPNGNPQDDRPTPLEDLKI